MSDKGLEKQSQFQQMKKKIQGSQKAYDRRQLQAFGEVSTSKESKIIGEQQRIFDLNKLASLSVINQDLRKNDINALKKYWSRGLQKELRLMLKQQSSSELYQNTELRFFVYLIEFKLAKYNLGYRRFYGGQLIFYRQEQQNSEYKSSSWNRYSAKNNIFEALYRGLSLIVERLRVKMQIPTFWDIFAQYLFYYKNYLGSQSLPQYVQQQSQRDWPFQVKIQKKIRQIFMISNKQHNITDDLIEKHFAKFYKMFKSQFSLEKSQTDTMFDKYIEHQAFIRAGVTYKYKSKKGQSFINDLIAESPSFFTGTSQWQQILTITNKIIQNLNYTDIFPIDKKTILDEMLEKQSIQNFQYKIANFKWLKQSQIKSLKYLKKKDQNTIKKKKFLDNIALERLQSVKCLACATFFYKDMNIRDDSINKVHVHTMPQIQNMRRYETQIRRKICAMLNSGGGVLLFACKSQALNIIIKGEKMSQLQKQKYQAQMRQMVIDTFYPKIDVTNNIVLTFVPVINNPIQNTEGQLTTYSGEQFLIKGESEQYRKRPYMQGIYVARLKVKPSHPDQMYLWRNIQAKILQKVSQQKIQCSQMINNQVDDIKVKDIVKHLKRKFKEYHSTNNIIENQFILRKSFDNFEVDCPAPDPGFKLVEDKIQNVKVKPSQNPELYYNYTSLVILPDKHIKDLRARLARQGQIFHIQKRFEQYDLKASCNSAILYHKSSFQDILNILNHDKYEFQGRRTHLVAIGDYLNIEPDQGYFPLNQEEVQQAQNFLSKEFPSDRLQFFQYMHSQYSQGCQYFVRTNTKLSTVLMFYYFKSKNLIVRFKGPRDFSRLKDQQRKTRWRQLHFKISKGLAKAFKEDSNSSQENARFLQGSYFIPAIRQ